MVIIETDRFLRLPHPQTKCFRLRPRMSRFVLPDHHPRWVRAESADPAVVGKVLEMKFLRSLMLEMLFAREPVVQLHLEEGCNIIISLLVSWMKSSNIFLSPFPNLVIRIGWYPHHYLVLTDSFSFPHTRCIPCYLFSIPPRSFGYEC